MAHWRDYLDPAAPAGDYLPWKVVAKRTSLSRTTAWRLQRRGEFPRPYTISPGRVGHLEREVDAWMASRSQPEPRAAPNPAPARAGPAAAAPSRGKKPPAGVVPQRAQGASPNLAPSRGRRPRAPGSAPTDQITFNF